MAGSCLHLSSDQFRQFLEDYARGLSDGEIMKKYGCYGQSYSALKAVAMRILAPLTWNEAEESADSSRQRQQNPRNKRRHLQ